MRLLFLTAAILAVYCLFPFLKTFLAEQERQRSVRFEKQQHELAEQERARVVQNEFARNRQLFLENVAMCAAEAAHVEAPTPPGMIPPTDYRLRKDYNLQLRQYYHNQCLRLLLDSDLQLVRDETEFKSKATDAAERYIRQIVSGMSFPSVRDNFHRLLNGEDIFFRRGY